jgi:hypothetical protein
LIVVKRFKWLTYGALLAAISISGGNLLWESNCQRAESLQKENERLALERAALKEEAERLAREGAELREIVQRLTIERRVAEVHVLQQHFDENGEVMQTVIQLSEIGRDGEPMPPTVFGIPSAVPHFDALVIKFDDSFVAQGDELRGHSLTLFRRVYGETQAPEDGYWLGAKGSVPDVYRVNEEPSEFEKRLWREFWNYASDPEKARGAGVRVAQGEAVYAPMKAGESWQLTLESDGGLNLIKQDDTAPLPMAKEPPPVIDDKADDDEQRLSAPSPLKS